MHSSDVKRPAAAGRWFKSSRSSGNGQCVEVNHDVDGRGSIGVRDSKNRSGPVLVFTRGEWLAFLAGAKDDEFDITG